METRNRMDEANRYYNEAARLCIEEISRNPSNMDSYTVLTWTLLRQKKYTELINWGERGLRVNPKDYRIVETMGEAYFYLDDYQQALSYLQHYVNSVPRGERASVAYFYIGEIYRLQSKFLHADIAYTTAVNLNSGMSLWWFRLGLVRESAGEFASAMAAYEKALSITPGYREASEGLERSRKQNAAAPTNRG
jgi:tetratricopeptide (TPR) repeat protein